MPRFAYARGYSESSRTASEKACSAAHGSRCEQGDQHHPRDHSPWRWPRPEAEERVGGEQCGSDERQVETMLIHELDR